jgi:hypothetical protein
MNRLELAAARYRLGLDDGASLRALGEALLSDEHDTDTAVSLAIVDDLALSEVGPVFEQVCRELKQTIPSLDEAIGKVSTAILRYIVDGSADPQTDLQRLMDEIYWPHLAVETKADKGQYIGESHNLQSLIGAYWSYDELLKRPAELSIDGKHGAEAIALLDERVRALAQDWLGKHVAT